MAASWLDLPREIWLLIFRLLNNNLFDVARFSATCSAFRSIESSDSKNNYHLSRPLLLMPGDEDSVTCDLFSLAPAPKRRKQVYELQIPELQNMHCYGSSYGWIFTVDLDSCWNQGQCSLLDPVNRLHISLPRLLIDPVKKAIILADPSQGNNCVVILISKTAKVLFFCRPGDKVWTHLSNHGEGFQDVTCHMGKFYAVTRYGKLVSWNHCHSNSAVSTVINPTEEEIRNSMPVEARYLINSTDGTELLMVCEYFDRRISVFKLGKEKSEFIEIERLGDDQALFLSRHCAFCVSTLSSAHFSPNYIYSSKWYNSVTGGLTEYAVYAYNLDDKSYKSTSGKKKIYKSTPGKRIYNRACEREAPCIWIMPGETLMSIALNMRAKKVREEAIETRELEKMCGLHTIGNEDEFLNKLIGDEDEFLKKVREEAIGDKDEFLIKFIDVQIREIEKWGKGKRNDFPQFAFTNE